MPTKKIRAFKPVDLYEVKQVYRGRLSPDGTELVTAAEAINKAENKKYFNLYVQPVKGGPVRQFTRGEAVDSSPEYSPDGKLIAFTSTRSGKPQLHLIHADGGESWQLTKMEGFVSGFTWAPDSKSVCITYVPQDEEAKDREKQSKLGKKGLNSPKKRHIKNFFYKLDGAGYLPEGKTELHMVNVKTGKTTELIKDGFHNGGPAFTPDGKYVLFSSNKHPDHELEPLRSDLYKVRADGKGKVTKIATHDGPANNPVVSPDGKQIAFTGWADPEKMWNEANDELFVVPISGGKPRSLSADLDRPVSNISINDTWGLIGGTGPVWSPCGKEIYTQVTVDGNTEIYRFDVKNGGGAPVLADPGVVLDFAIDFAKGKLYYVFSDFENPGDLFSRNLDGGKPKQLTKFNAKWLSKRDLGNIEEMWVKGRDGSKIQGWVMTPPDYNPKKKYPGILYIHGGPHVAYARSIMTEFNYLAGQGYVVFFCNPRGSQGYGVEHVGCIAEGWGDKDYSDLMKFTDAVLRRYKSIDKDRIGVTGGSYGGYMTNWIIGHTQRFKAAVTQRSVSNFLSFMGSCDVGYLFHYNFRSRDKSPWEDRERFLKLSPMSYMTKAKTPTLVIHSENDLRCPIEQGEQVYVQLKLQGVDTELLRFPEESHGLSRGGRTDRRIERLEAISGWFDKYLMNKK